MNRKQVYMLLNKDKYLPNTKLYTYIKTHSRYGKQAVWKNSETALALNKDVIAQ